MQHNHNPNQLTAQQKVYHVSRAARYSISRLESGVYVLKIANVTSEDAGMYSCYSTHLGQSSSAYLVVLGLYIYIMSYI